MAGLKGGTIAAVGEGDVGSEDKPFVAALNVIKTDMIDILCQEIPFLAPLPRDIAFETVLNEPPLLDNCFRLFRRQPELFARVVSDGSGRPITDERLILSCGRSLGELKSMILQASARRFFRRTLGPPRRFEVEAKRGVGRRLAESLHLVQPLPPKMRRIAGGGDRFFEVIRTFLRFDWQARLIPPYATLPPAFVRDHGPLLLDIREPSEVAVLATAEGREAILQRGRPLFMGTVRDLMLPRRDRLDADLLWTVFNQMDLSRLMPGADPPDLQHATVRIAETSRAVIETLGSIVGGNLRPFVTFLFVAYAKLGAEQYRDTFVENGFLAWMTPVYFERLSAINPFPPPDFEEMVSAFGPVFSPRKKSGKPAPRR